MAAAFDAAPSRTPDTFSEAFVVANEQQKQFPIVGIGASAGGIEALQQFFRALPTESGLAFVVVTHLPPGRESSLVPIISQYTAMPVVAAEDGMVVEPNRTHVLSHEGILTIENGRLRLRGPEAVRERHPIDVFFASLAVDRAERSVGIVLSGGGSDGTLGIKAVKQHGGLTLAQGSDHHERRHASMPESAIATGLVDLVLPVHEMPANLIAYFSGFAVLDDRFREKDHTGRIAAACDAICRILRRQLGHDFSGYKGKTFLRRVQRRMQVLHLGDIDAYVSRLDREPDEARLLFRDLLISVTSFFRDMEAFDELAARVIPRILAGKGADDTVRVWVPGCATGEEVYSIAILLLEGMDKLPALPKVQVFATDIDEPALAVARAARYPSSLLDGISPERLQRFFTAVGGSYSLTREVRDLCIFSAHSVIRDPPFSRIDLISCRNLLIYLDGDLQSRVIPIFHYALRPGGYLFLGTSENITQHAELFTPLTKKQRLFQRRDQATVTVPVPLFLPGRNGNGAAPVVLAGSAGAMAGVPHLEGLPLRQAVERRVLERFAPAFVVVNRDDEVVYYSSRTGKYLEPAPGAPNRQLIAMARKGLRLELRAALREAEETRRRVRREGLSVEIDDRVQTIALTIEPLPDEKNPPLFLVVFEDVGRPLPPEEAWRARSTREDSTVEHLETELRETRERLQATVEEYETAVEELKSANEELVSVNEELQSTNEELETAKEEQQSVNEEMHTINAELNVKVDELDRANADLKNLFESTQIATLFLDRHLVIRSFTPAVTTLFNLIPTDRGRPLTDIANQLEAVDLRADIQHVLDTREPLERRVSGGAAKGTHYLMRILPYRAGDNTIDGVLVTFVDVNKVVAAEDHQLLLIAELNHRVRNMLGVVIGLVTQSAARAPEVSAFTNRLLERLHALAGTYGLVSRDNWTPVQLRELVQQELEPYLLGEEKQRITLEGAPVSLAPKAALAFGMAFHELATNAAKHGALLQPTGSIEVSWAIDGGGKANGEGKADGGNGAAPRLVVRWREAGGPVDNPGKGFGTDLLRRLLSYEVDGEAALEFTPQGVRAELSVPVDGELVRINDEPPAAPDREPT
ncbi:MAG: chemotaxis protein CheR [Rhodospirillales bacterium]|nr:chemotaxis protein CheR [Rhodospirillales bacterium]